MAESRLERWARKKKEARQTESVAAPATVEPTTELDASPEEQELTVNESLPEQDLLKKYDLPDPDNIELGTDITGFMRKEIPELLRRKALRSLWKSNPVLAVLDGLNDYDEDFTDAGTGTVKTLYKVGQGLIDKTKKIEEKIDELADEQPETLADNLTETTESINPVRLSEKSAPKMYDAPQSPARQPPARETETVATETEEESEPRYRPRMRFE